MKNNTVIQSAPHTNKIIGFAGPTPLEITLDEHGKISKVELLKHKETPAYVQKVKESGLLQSWNGLSPKEAIAKPIDAVSGATFTSKGITETLRKRLEIYEAENVGFRLSTSVIFGVGIIGLSMLIYLIFYRKRRKK